MSPFFQVSPTIGDLLPVNHIDMLFSAMFAKSSVSVFEMACSKASSSQEALCTRYLTLIHLAERCIWMQGLALKCLDVDRKLWGFLGLEERFLECSSESIAGKSETAPVSQLQGGHCGCPPAFTL